jgi:outer membrane protein
MLRRIPLTYLFAAALFGQQTLTRQEAERIALQQSPAIGSSRFAAAAAGEVAAEHRSNYLPQFYGSVTAAGASDGSRIAAGGLNNPIIYNRLATGIGVSQMVTDFGRTSNLVAGAGLHAKAADQNTETTRAQTVLEVDRAYYGVLKAQNVLKVAEQTVKARQLVVDQVTALAQSKLRSDLDVSFAKVNLSEAQLMLASAQNDVKSSRAQLSAAMGFSTEQYYRLADEPMPGILAEDAETLVREAMRQRPELAASRLEQDSAERYAKAERALSFPTLSMVGAVGYVPGTTTAALPTGYGAAGLNVTVPVFNGGLFTARRREAEMRARAAGQDVQNLQNEVARDVRVAFLEAETAYERVGLTARMLDQARLALDLAQARYDIGLGSIVELSQAQLNATSAEIGAVSARYDYQAVRSVLSYAVGTNR